MLKNAYTIQLSAKMGMHSIIFRNLAFIILLLIFPQKSPVLAQDLPEYDEISIFLEIPGTGGTEIDAVIRDNELYLPVATLFDFLKIKNNISADQDIISGFFINPDATYSIEKPHNRIIYEDNTYSLEPGELIRTESNLYLKSEYFGKIFGIECIFNFRNLSVSLKSKLELPYIRERRLEEMRRNIIRLKGEFEADSSIERSYPLFRFGMADWSAIATEDSERETETRLNLSLGGILAGGEATATLNYNSNYSFKEKHQHYLWRYANNDFKAFRQIRLGKIPTQAATSLFNPVVGVQITNTPTTYRKAFGTYIVSDKTEPGWIVELYVNNVLIDYVKADGSGFYKFDVPLVYGNSMVKLKFYSPWGEERTKEQIIVIPFNFVPVKTMEYTLTSGIVEDTLMSRFSRAAINYGVSAKLTVGGGFEYLSSLPYSKFMPFVNLSVKLSNNVLITGDYIHGVRAKGTLSYRLPSNLQVDLNYTRYKKDQKAIFYNYVEERKGTISMPLRIGKFSSFNRLSVYQILLPENKYTNCEWMLSGSLFGINTNLTTYAMLIQDTDPFVFTNLSLALRIPGGFIVMPQAQYEYTLHQIISAKIKIEKNLLKHAYLNLSYERNFKNELQLAELGLRYDFAFANTGISFRQMDKSTSMVQYARGSIINDRTTRYLGADNRTNVGKGGISIIPFLDLNGNSRKDPGEPKAYGLNLHANSGQVKKDDKDTTIYLLGLEPYTKCFIELDPNSFENISWRLSKKTLSVSVDPNMVKLIEIPVLVAGEATGTVETEEKGIRKGLARIIVNFETSGGKPAGRVLSEEDGYFSFLGLAPGKYKVRIDTAQLRKLNMTAEPDSIRFNVAGGTEGDIVDGLGFILKKISKDTIRITEAGETGKPFTRKDTAWMVVHEVVEELVTITEDSWAIQLGAFRVRSNAEKYRRTLEKLLNRKVDIVIEDNFWKVRIPDLKTREEVDRSLGILKKNGVTEVWVIQLKAKQQQIILTERQDTVLTITETDEIIEEPSFDKASSIEVGTFENIKRALDLKDTLFTSIQKPVLIIREKGLFRVRITGFKDYEEMLEFISSLGNTGIKDVRIETTRKTKDHLRLTDEPEKTEKDTVYKPEDIQIQQPPVEEKSVELQEPTVAIQVGIFHKKAQALKAKRKISAKLNLPVEIVLQWDYYHVIVTGFHTKEETYKYYPEFAAIGYPGVSVIENYIKQE